MKRTKTKKPKKYLQKMLQNKSSYDLKVTQRFWHIFGSSKIKFQHCWWVQPTRWRPAPIENNTLTKNMQERKTNNNNKQTIGWQRLITVVLAASSSQLKCNNNAHNNKNEQPRKRPIDGIGQQPEHNNIKAKDKRKNRKTRETTG